MYSFRLIFTVHTHTHTHIHTHTMQSLAMSMSAGMNRGIGIWPRNEGSCTNIVQMPVSTSWRESNKIWLLRFDPPLPLFLLPLPLPLLPTCGTHLSIRLPIHTTIGSAGSDGDRHRIGCPDHHQDLPRVHIQEHSPSQTRECEATDTVSIIVIQ